jgi:hypothetical protein
MTFTIDMFRRGDHVGVWKRPNKGHAPHPAPFFIHNTTVMGPVVTESTWVPISIPVVAIDPSMQIVVVEPPADCVSWDVQGYLGKSIVYESVGGLVFHADAAQHSGLKVAGVFLHCIDFITHKTQRIPLQVSNLGQLIPPTNDHVCPLCRNTRCSKTEKSCWRCGADLHPSGTV